MGFRKIIKTLKTGTSINAIGLLISLALIVSDQFGALGQRSNRWVDGSLRLVGGRSKNEGTVLVYHWSRWGAVCDDYWDIKDANVVCNELGYTGAKEAVTGSRFGKGRRRVWLSGLHCRGTEEHLTMCYSRGWGRHVRRCRSYRSSAGVICNTEPRKTTTASTTKTTQTTTTKTTTTPRSTTTTTKTTTPRPTTAAPKTLKTTTRKPTTLETTTRKPTTPPPPTTSKRITERTTTPTTTKRPTTTATTRTTRKTTTTSRPQPRVYGRWVYNQQLWRYFMYYRDGTFITSRPDPRYYEQLRNEITTEAPKTTTTKRTTTTTTTTTTPRPRPFHQNSIYNANSLDTRDHFSRNNVIDETVSNLVPDDSSSHHRRHHRHRNQHFYEGKAGYVGDQPADVPTDSAGHFEQDYEVTQKPAATTAKPAPDYDEFRVVGGRKYGGYMEGRLEVRLAGSHTWGVVCGDNWEFRAAIVTCKHMGVGYARMAQTNDFYGGSAMDKVLATIRCTGREDRLEDCTKENAERTPGRITCSRAGSVAGVICETRLPDLEPNIHELQYSAYLQDRYLYYLQCAYEEGCLASSANAMYGTNSWTYSTRRLFRFSTIAKNIGTADFRPIQDRSQWEWHACHRHYHSMESFSHYDIIDSHGNQMAEGHKASFCLEDSACDRGVYPKYDCNGYGQQGISVGCQDSYLADIDCQWIDVTDLKAGTYTFKMELNPSMSVPEISYDNNVVRCNMYFTYQTVQLTNCTLDSLL